MMATKLMSASVIFSHVCTLQVIKLNHVACLRLELPVYRMAMLCDYMYVYIGFS